MSIKQRENSDRISIVSHNNRLHLTQTYLFIFFLLFFFVLFFFAFLWWRLLKFLGVLQEKGVSKAGPQEKVAGLHGHHLGEESTDTQRLSTKCLNTLLSPSLENAPTF